MITNIEQSNPKIDRLETARDLFLELDVAKGKSAKRLNRVAVSANSMTKRKSYTRTLSKAYALILSWKTSNLNSAIKIQQTT